ncbi:type IV toxin-antitoxin system AbiEi family antitoxin [Paractinoplanes rhizophilus]|uniref:Type IV toxin-antitoxin system AbiEi family antitoxin n=1 Tax=Paractinoplanes rhizophilus TaxID=1416877 RepID=A0ABW2I106_9ACTN
MFREHEQGGAVNGGIGARMRPRSDELLDSALTQLADAGVVVAEIGGDDRNAGGRLLQLSLGGRTCTYEVQLRTKVSPASAQTSRPSPGRKLLLVAPHISDQTGEALRRQHVHYVDSVGNMFLRGDGLLLDVRGRRGPAIRPGTPGKPLRAFKSSGLKVIFALLADPDLVTATYREISRASGVSLGTVQWVLAELETAGYVTTNPRQLHRTRKLFDRWVEAYAFDLWPRLTLATFDAMNPDWWKNADDSVRAAGALWGGESAAHRINPRLRPQKAVLYATEVPRQLAIDYRFRNPHGDGGVEVRQLFWHLPAKPSLTVPTPLIYGDLVASADPRLTEAAADLRENDALLQRLDRG